MAGSPIYGAGYYKGNQDGYEEGLGKGAGLGAVGVLVLAGAVFG